MISNHEDDEFVAVRVQDPRTQNEGSWNSYVDYKIFLHTNSKAFTAKTSCVRRRYSEFEWLRKKLQKNAGLVPVPDLPGKSFFSFNNEDFLEKRRRGLQVFLDKVVHTTVCLSDSQLHLFLQTQLPVGHIQDCVQGLTPYSVTDAILTYASSNRGLAQAQQEDSVREPSLTISYESMESPAPHQPSLQPHPTIHPKPVPGGDSDPLEDILELCEQRPDETRRGGDASIRISQRSDQLEAVVEGGASARASFYLGEIQADSESLGSAEQSCVIQTPVEVHSPMGTGCEGDDVFEDKTAPPASEERSKSDSVMCVGSEEALTVEDDDDEQEAGGSHAASEEVAQAGGGRPAEVKPGNETEPDSREETAPQSGTRQERQTVEGEPEEDGGDSRQRTRREEAKNGDGEDSDEDSRSLPSSNDSIVRCSEEESLSEEAEEAMQVKPPPDGLRNGSEADGSGRAVFYMNGCNGDEADGQDRAGDGQPCTTNGECPEPKPAAADGDLSENCDFSILGTSCQPGVDDGTFTNHQAPVSIALGGSEESWNQSYPTKAAPPSLGQNHEALVSSPAEP